MRPDSVNIDWGVRLEVEDLPGYHWICDSPSLWPEHEAALKRLENANPPQIKDVSDVFFSAVMCGRSDWLRSFVLSFEDREDLLPLMRFFKAQIARFDARPAREWAKGWQVGLQRGHRGRAAVVDGLPYVGSKDLTGERVLITSEGGIGDQVRRSAFLRQIARICEKAVCEVDAKVLPALSAQFPNIEFCQQSERQALMNSGAVTGYIGASDLEVLFWDPETSPQPNNHLFPEFEPNAGKAARVGERPRIGFSFRSSLLSRHRAAHYHPIECWAGILAAWPDVDWVCLQYDLKAEEKDFLEAAYGRSIEVDQPDPYFGALQPLYSQLMSLDMVVSASNMVADLSASMGIETWRMQFGGGFASETTTNNPWYGSGVRMFYRRDGEPWSKVFGDLHIALQEPV